jgi:hypothetical protein
MFIIQKGHFIKSKSDYYQITERFDFFVFCMDGPIVSIGVSDL